jgi:hypothetical protein
MYVTSKELDEKFAQFEQRIDAKFDKRFELLEQKLEASFDEKFAKVLIAFDQKMETYLSVLVEDFQSKLYISKQVENYCNHNCTPYFIFC